MANLNGGKDALTKGGPQQCRARLDGRELLRGRLPRDGDITGYQTRKNRRLLPSEPGSAGGSEGHPVLWQRQSFQQEVDVAAGLQAVKPGGFYQGYTTGRCPTGSGGEVGKELFVAADDRSFSHHKRRTS